MKTPYKMIKKLSDIYYGPERVKIIKEQGEIFSISSGVSSLTLPSKYKELLYKEIQEDAFYSWYTSSEGGNIAIGSILFFENYLAGGGRIVSEFTRNQLAISTGSSELIYLFFEYIGNISKKKTVLLTGLNYFLFSEACIENDLCPIDIISKDEGKTFPSYKELISKIEEIQPIVLVLAIPGNPSGEVYTSNELIEIFRCLRENSVFLLLDRVCLDEISYSNYYSNVEELVILTDMKEKTFLVNSLSKTRSIAGMRIGYAISSEEIISYIKRKNYLLMFSPPSTGSLMLVFDMLVRCILYKTCNCNICIEEAFDSILKVFRHYMQITCPLSAGELCKMNNILDFVYKDSIKKDVIEAINELKLQYTVISQNISYSFDVLKNYISECIEPVHGYNYVLKLRGLQLDQYKTSIYLFEKFGVEILPEKCFRIENDYEVDEMDKDYWIRISAATSNANFARALERLLLALRSIM